MKKTPILPDSPFPDNRTGEGRLHAPSAERNLHPIKEVLKRVLPETGDVFELASGTGQHIVAFAAQWPDLTWQPSDLAEERLVSIRAWHSEAGSDNLCAPVTFDAVSGWPGLKQTFDFIYVVNLLHLISEPDAANVLQGMAGALNPGGTAMVYGPFRNGAAFRSDGDEKFDASLRAQDSAIGYKSWGWVQSQFAAAGLTNDGEIEMPANNLVLLARKLR